MSKKLRKRFCPNCEHQLDAVTHLGDGDIKPRRGDITICINCAEILQFDKNIRPVKLRGATLYSLPADVLKAVTEARKHLIEMIKEQ